MTATATFKAYQGADRDLLISRLVELEGWSHIGQVRASAQINHVEVDCFFTKFNARVQRAICKATFFGAWKIQSIA